MCIFPRDTTTEFLRPVYELICKETSVCGIDADSVDTDDYLENLERVLQDAKTIIFLGHGSSHTLYGTMFNPLFDERIGNVKWLRNKHLILFACRTLDFIKKHGLHTAMGFGFIPTTLDDVRDNGELHKLDITDLTKADLKVFRDSIVKVWKRCLRHCPLNDIYRFLEVFSMYTNIEIVDVLMNHRDIPHYRKIADMLYYLYKDMDYVE